MTNWQTIVVSPSVSIRDAVQVINTGALQIALVADEAGKLLGTITDGDIRRGILRGLDLNESVIEIMNPNPVWVSDCEESSKILFLMKHAHIRQVPLVDRDHTIVGLRTMDELMSQTPRRENIVVLMAGGLGTRLAPLTQDCPKPLLQVGGRPILETILESLIEKGFYRFYLSVNYKAEMVRRYFGDGSRWNCEIQYLQENQRLGTAGALSLLSDPVTEPFLVMNGDIMTRVDFASLLEFHQQRKADATMCIREFNYTVPYGVVKLEGNRIASIVEKPTERMFVSAGIYVLSPMMLDRIPVNQFYDMPTLFQDAMDHQFTTAGFPIHEYWLDIGRLEDFDRAQAEFQEVFHG